MANCPKCRAVMISTQQPRPGLDHPANPNREDDWIAAEPVCSTPGCRGAADMVPSHMRPQTTPTQRRQAFDRISSPGPVNCANCGKHAERHVMTICAACFEEHGVPPADGQAAATPLAPEPSCGFCGRSHGQIVKAGQTMSAGKSAMICSVCACSMAGCIGAKSAPEARAMMATMALQAKAVERCEQLMDLAALAADELFTAGEGGQHKRLDMTTGLEKADMAKELADIAEVFARIAKGIP